MSSYVGGVENISRWLLIFIEPPFLPLALANVCLGMATMTTRQDGRGRGGRSFLLLTPDIDVALVIHFMAAMKMDRIY